jgi:hypothetical protein
VPIQQEAGWCCPVIDEVRGSSVQRPAAQRCVAPPPHAQLTVQQRWPQQPRTSNTSPAAVASLAPAPRTHLPQPHVLGSSHSLTSGSRWGQSDCQDVVRGLAPPLH